MKENIDRTLSTWREGILFTQIQHVLRTDMVQKGLKTSKVVKPDLENITYFQSKVNIGEAR